VIGQPSHLREIAHGRFWNVRLPVGVGGERDGRVPGQVRPYIREFLWIKRQPLLCALNQIKQDEGNSAKQQHRRPIFGPAHLLRFINAAQPVD